VIQNLAVDFELTMGLAGCRTTADIDAEALVPAPAAGPGSVRVP
jgi:hypothetical protein